ncbi:MAG: signal peptidase I [Chloroflexota bacterium]|nr:signal peptidase I [Chloroflexota bacterium]
MTTPSSPAAILRTPGVLSGNAVAADPARSGWFVGHFMPNAGDPRSTPALEVKWAVYQGGETRQGWAANRAATTLAVLVRGRFRLRFPEREVLLASEGDYALWEPGVPHHWTAETAAVVLTVRWPSVADDSLLVPDPGPAESDG